MKDEKLNGIPRQSSAQRFPYFQNGAATLKGREAPGTRLRFFGVLIHAHGANHIILNLTNRFGEKRKGERAVTPRELWRFTRSISFRKKMVDPCISLRPKFSLLQTVLDTFLVAFQSYLNLDLEWKHGKQKSFFFGPAKLTILGRNRYLEKHTIGIWSGSKRK